VRRGSKCVCIGRPPQCGTKVTLSKWLVFLMAVRPALNQLRGDTSLMKLGDYNVSLLSVWSILYLLIAVARFSHGPAAPPRIRFSITAFLLVVVGFGVPRMLMREALVTDVLAFFQFFLAALTARGVIEDVGIDYVLKQMVRGAAVLVAMHVTAPIWMPERDLSLNDVVGNYLGAFESKHIAGASFFALVPHLFCAALRDRRGLGALLLVPTALFLVLALQRVSILSALIFGVSVVAITRRVRILLPLVVLTTLVIAVIPSERFEAFMEEKVEQEIDAYRSGDLDSTGAGRMGIILLARNWYFDHSSISEQLVGRGTAQAYQLHDAVVGHMAYAHIEVIELLIDYGLVGTLLVFTILVQIGRSKMQALRAQRTPEELVGMAMLVVVVAQLFYAMPLQDGGTVTLFAFWLFPRRAAPLPPVGSL